MADEERRPKRSRFDQTEPEARKPSRFDRRSRSPAGRASESRRSRSPVRSPPDRDSKTPTDPAAAAAAAAARINAQLQAKKGIQHVDVPPIQSIQSPVTEKSPTPASGHNEAKVGGDMYMADGDYIKDIEVNDLRNRYTLTKGSTQKMIKEETGADVTTRGSYYPDKKMATAANPPLYLHITSTSKAGLEKAIAKVDELMKQELPNLVDDRRFRRREPEQVERDEFGRRKWPEEKIPIDMESLPGFNLRAQVVGQGGAYVKHIQQETRCRVQIKGRGSGFMEHGTGQESDEPMYLHVAGPDPREVARAKDLCEDLLANVREQYERHKANPPPQHSSYLDGYGANSNSGGGGGGGGGGGYGRSGGYGERSSYADRSSHHNQYSTQTSNSPAPGAAPGAGGSLQDYYAQYYGANGPASAAQGGADPYAAYGGYNNYVAYYQAYYAQQQQQAQQPTSASPPPPPASGDAPPPPPGGSPPPPPPGNAPGYNAVPPPPGM